jgi:hypothetical protein
MTKPRLCVTVIFVKLKRMGECNGRKIDNMGDVIMVNWVSIGISAFWGAPFMPERLNAKSRK